MVRAYHRNWGLCNLRWDASLVGMSKEPTLDDTTGLPVVPEGYFWRVRWKYEANLGWFNLSVSLRETLPSRWYKKNRSRKVNKSTERIRHIYPRYSSLEEMFNVDDLRPNVVAMADYVLRLEEKAIKFAAMRKTLYTELEKLEGDYPPKTLKDK